jgi:hypothetical protein
LISLTDVQNEFSLGPNSSFMYCFDFLEKNIDWLAQKIKSLGEKYLLFDCPGQIEIFTVSDSFKKIIQRLTSTKTEEMLFSKTLSLCVVNLIESSNLLDLPRYVFSIFSVLNAMINLALPQINIISKIDLLKNYDKKDMPFSLGFYKNPSDIEKITLMVDEINVNPKFKKLNKLIAEFVTEYGLVSFDILDVSDQKHLNKIATLIDKANGYIYLNKGGIESEQYIEVRNEIAKNDLEFDDEEEDDYLEG